MSDPTLSHLPLAYYLLAWAPYRRFVEFNQRNLSARVIRQPAGDSVLLSTRLSSHSTSSRASGTPRSTTALVHDAANVPSSHRRRCAVTTWLTSEARRAKPAPVESCIVGATCSESFYSRRCSLFRSGHPRRFGRRRRLRPEVQGSSASILTRSIRIRRTS